MIIHINGRPGVGKLTVGRLVAEALGGRLVDNHSIYNLALALTEMKSDAYFAMLRAVRAVAFEGVLALPPGLPVVLTNAHFQDSDWGNENWDAVIGLARARGGPLLVVVLDCEPAENDRRVASPDRALKRKPTDPSVFAADLHDRALLDRGGDRTLRLDTTALSASETAAQVLAWARAADA